MAVLKFTDSFTLVTWRRIIYSFCAGLCVCFVAMLLFRASEWAGIPFYAPVEEELLKFIVLLLLVGRRRIVFIQQALCYGAAIGAGFAFAENLIYIKAFTDMSVGTAIFRGLGTAVLHMACPMIAATFLACAAMLKDANSRWEPVLVANTGLLSAMLIHALFNMMLLPIWVQLALTLIVFSALVSVISEYNERRICRWLDQSINNDISLLKAIREGKLAQTKQGQYLLEVKSQFSPETVADMLCYIRLYLELIIEDKSRLMLREAGLEPELTGQQVQQRNDTVKEFYELRRRIGKAGEKVLNPIVRLSRDDAALMWEVNRTLHGKSALILLLLALASHPASAQKVYQYRQVDTLSGRDLTLTFFSPKLSQYIPHIVRNYNYAVALHRQNWGIEDGRIKSPLIMIGDWEDDGNGGASPLPYNVISVGMAPVNMSYYVGPMTERYSHLFRHEYTHTVMTDHASTKDMRWRNFFGGAKVAANNQYPLSILWSYLSVPRWYSPRWFHEGIACFMETWTGGGVGRALGGYDEMYFRTLVNEGETLSSVVGLESEGTTSDFQLGTNAYLYGTRFVNYLTLQYGYDKLKEFYYRSDDSRTLYSNQFKKVYGQRLGKVWNQWRQYENEHQKKNLDIIRDYPLTQLEPVIDSRKESFALGSASPMVVDDSLGVAYAAVNYPGALPHIEKIDLATGKRKKLAVVEGPMMYQTAYLTLDRKRQRLVWTIRNGSWRGFKCMDLKSGKTSTHNFQRVNNIVYDNAGDCMYGLLSHEGLTRLVCYSSDFKEEKIIYSFKFGVSVSDMDISHDGSKLVLSMFGGDGSCKIICFNTRDLHNARYEYSVICSMPDVNLSQFRFSADDSRLVGCSYYTGVSNLWEVEPKEGAELKLLSNVETGLFAPYMMADGTIYAYKFVRNGMLPVKLRHGVLEDCNAVSLLGQEAYEKNSKALESLSVLRQPLKAVEFGQVYDSIKLYKPLKHMRFTGAFPDISGFTDKGAWNRVTPVLGYHVAFSDPLGLSTLNISVGTSPWSGNPWKNRFHLSAEWKFWNWTFSAAWNPTNFYDLFGPMRRSRKGYNFGVSYDRKYTVLRPLEVNWGASLNAYGDMDALPLYQEIEVDKGISSFQTASLYVSAGNTQGSLGAIMAEQGWTASMNANTYLAGGKFFPSVSGTFAGGFLLPLLRNTSFWIRSAIGQNFGSDNSAFGNDYFGGFRNNYVDCGNVLRYRTTTAMPGLPIDAVKAHSYLKFTGEINFQPIRFKHVGALTVYPTYAQISVFSTDLLANPWGPQSFHNHVNIGAQLNVEIVFFNYFKTTWSVGYAHAFNQFAPNMPGNSGQWLFSLKLL